MSYESAPATKMLATQCACCGRPLVDAESVECGMGPVCREEHGWSEMDSEVRRMTNQLTWAASVYATLGQVGPVMRCADGIAALGLEWLAGRIRERFRARGREKKIRAWRVAGEIWVRTPFRRGEAAEYLHAWRSIPGRRYRGDGTNSVPDDEATLGLVRALLVRFFPGQYADWLGEEWRIPGARPGKDGN